MFCSHSFILYTHVLENARGERNNYIRKPQILLFVLTKGVRVGKITQKNYPKQGTFSSVLRLICLVADVIFE